MNAELRLLSKLILLTISSLLLGAVMMYISWDSAIYKAITTGSYMHGKKIYRFQFVFDVDRIMRDPGFLSREAAYMMRDKAIETDRRNHER